MTKLSVIIPVYGVEKYLPECLDSLYSQITPECQIVLVDDGSPDRCGAICDDYARRYPENTLVIHQENMGQGGARNNGVERASGEYVFFVDSDDSVPAGAIPTLLSAIDKYNTDIIGFAVNLVDEEGKFLSLLKDSFETDTVFDPKKEKRLITGQQAPWNRIVRRSILIENGIAFTLRVWYEDIRTTPKYTVCSDSVVYIEDSLYNYRLREGSTMNNSKVDRNIEIIWALDDLIEWFSARGIYEDYKEELEYLLIDHVFISATVRVIRSAGAKHPLVKTFREYTDKHCGILRGSRNSYVENVLEKNRKLILKLLCAKLYFAVKLIFKIKK